MTFQWPGMLWLLLALPLLVLGYILLLRAKGPASVRYSALGMVREAAGSTGRLRRHLPAVLGLLALAMMFVALSRPTAEVMLLSGRQTVILAMDISGSMRARDIQPSRFEAMQAAARDFVKGQPSNVDIGVVAFAATATLVQAPTRNREDVLAAIDRFRQQRGTAVGNAILTALSSIFEDIDLDLGPIEQGRRGHFGQAPAPTLALPEPVKPGSHKSAVIILISDGQANTGRNPLDAARISADLGVRIYTVGFGTVTGEVIGYEGWSMRAQLDEESLKAIADLTRGAYFRADSDTNLLDIYRRLDISPCGKLSLRHILVSGSGTASS